MTVDPERQERLRQVQQDLMKHDPEVLDYDTSNENDAVSIETTEAIIAGMETGEPFIIVVECEDDSEYEIYMHPIGSDTDGKPMYAIALDEVNRESPAALAMVEALLTPDHQREIDNLIGECL